LLVFFHPLRSDLGDVLPYRVRRGVTVAAIGEVWAAFSPASGDTQLLNDEAAAVLEVLDEFPRTPAEVAQVIAIDADQPLDTVDQRLQGAFSLLQAAGLIEGIPTAQGGK
jgi:PqqD family protein of HPr-rel-A system